MKTHQEYNDIKVGQTTHGRCVTMGKQVSGTVKEIRTWPREFNGGVRYVIVDAAGREHICFA